MGDYFYVDGGGGQAGPVPADSLKSMQRSGQVDGNTLAWKDGMAEWTPISKISELQVAPARPARPARPAPPSAPQAAQQRARPSHSQPRGGAVAAAQQANGGWKTRKTVDGGDYYHNILTDEVSWEKPPELQTPEERQTDSSDCVWLPSERDGGWVPAYVLQRTARSIKVRPVEGGSDTEVPSSGRGAQQLVPLKLSHLERRSMQEDVVLLESIDPALVAYCLRHRYREDQIYTWVGADHTVPAYHPLPVP